MRKTITPATQEELKRVLDYNPDTGIFVWKLKNRAHKSGVIAGNIHRFGYRRISVNKTECKAHRLAWLYVYGEWPTKHIDHINGIKDDNRICNLRDVSQRDNSLNKKIHREGKLQGCTFHKNGWQVGINENGRQRYIGRYKTEQEAHARYLIEREKVEQECRKESK
jgi:hypothetical protein